MKNLTWTLVLLLAILLSCEKEKKEETHNLDIFNEITPEGWQCKVIQNNFNEQDISAKANTPTAIVKYKYQNNQESSLILNLYPIEQKQDLINLIKSQQMFSNCIPIYYGETKEYFIVTSPCFLGNGNTAINDLHTSLKQIITKNNYEGIIN